jgi:ADP-ribose pyrophosphatase YjhB (NUDIX family)
VKQFARAIVLKDGTLLVMRREKAGRKYCSLVGGAVDPGETPEQALYRELAEETGIEVANHRLVITQEGGGFGMQYIYLCDYVSGEPVLAPDSIEAKIRIPKQDYYDPGWLSLKDLTKANLLPAELKKTLLDILPDNFPQRPITVTINNMETN